MLFRSFDFMMARGWPANKIVIGMVTNPGNGSGWVPFEILQEVLITLKSRYPGLGGVMGWEYFNSLPGDRDKPWEWAAFMTRNLKGGLSAQAAAPVVDPPTQVASILATQQQVLRLVDEDITEVEAPLPQNFEYYSDGSTSE